MKKRGFTLVEILVVISVIAVLAAIVIVIYTPFQIRAARTATQAELDNARSALELYNGIERDYPPNLAGVNYSAPTDVVLTLYTNAPQVRKYTNLTSDQNAQLLLNSCNANMPVVDGSTTYNTACSFAGNNFHVTGVKTSNIVLQGPTIQKADFNLTCGSACDAASTSIISQFEEQGGTWPVTVPKKQVELPAAALESYGKATMYCLSARYATYTDVVYYVQSGSSIVHEGDCPANTELHYP